MPLKDDEVLVAFEHGDVQHPYIIGSLWNGTDTPGDLVHTDGSYALHTEQQIVMKADKAIEISGKDTFKLESKGDMTITATNGSIKQDASTGEVAISGQTITIKGQSISIEGTTVKVSGMVQLG
jgi:uncharacterized protein involved in type VI secretion and phage assembly